MLQVLHEMKNNTWMYRVLLIGMLYRVLLIVDVPCIHQYYHDWDVFRWYNINTCSANNLF